MTIVFATVLLVIAVVLLLWGFARADAASLAGTLRLAGPVVMAVVGVAAALFGRAGVGGLIVSGALAWYGLVRRKAPAGRKTQTIGKRSSVRTAAIEMELNHDTGGLEGQVLAGRHEQRMLGSMSLKELLELHKDVDGDGESRQLLETYLDSRFPVWREHPDTDRRHRKRIAPGSGAMTKQEAYQVLGLETGATAADIREAHRRLMQSLHPDIGGSAFLAARINEAKDVLLTNHD